MTTINNRPDGNLPVNMLGEQLGASDVTWGAQRELANHWAKVRRFYEQTGLSRKTRHATVSSCRRQWLVWCSWALAAYTSSSPALMLESGATPLAVPTGSYSDGRYSWTAVDSRPNNGDAFGSQIIIPTELGGTGDLLTDCSSAPPPLVVDGYTGYQLQGTDAIIYLTGGIYSNRQLSLGGSDFVNLIGTSYNSLGGGGTWCKSSYFPSVKTSGDLITPVVLQPGSLRAHVYVPPGARSFRTPSFNISIGRCSRPGGVGCKTPLTISVPDLQYDPVTCSVDHSPAVGFGVLTGRESRSVSSSFDVFCTSKADKPLSITALGTTTEGADRLSMTTPDGSRVADVLGSLGSGTRACGASPAPGSLYFDGRPVLAASTISAGLQSLPVEWTLCPAASAEPGVGTARATIDVTW